MINELKPCPFCGGEAEYKCDMKIIPIYDADGTYIDADIGDYIESVHCVKCGAEIYCIEEGEGVAVEKWNRRIGE